MGETLPSWKPTCNSPIAVQLSNRKTRSDSGALLLREVLDRSGVIESLDRQLLDDRDSARVQHSLPSQLRALLIQRARGWDDLSDTQTLANDPVLQLACSDQRSTTPLEQPRPLQPTLSRLLNQLPTDSTRLYFSSTWPCGGCLRCAAASHSYPLRWISMVYRLKALGTKSELVTTAMLAIHTTHRLASITETGDMVGGLLREGNNGCAVQAEHWIPKLVERIGKTVGTKVRFHFDAGFTGNPTLRR